MPTINIAPHIGELLVFDDPEYCNEFTEECEFLERSAWPVCQHFNNEELAKRMLDERIYYEKCPQCKEAYQKAKL